MIDFMNQDGTASSHRSWGMMFFYGRRNHMDLQYLINELEVELLAVHSRQQLNDLRVKYLGKKSVVQQAMSQFGKLSAAERAVFGQQINQVKTVITEKFALKNDEIEALDLANKLAEEEVDISLPGDTFTAGSKSVIQAVVDEITSLGIGLGYEIAEGPELETDHYNFEMLNLPKDHPARDMQDTFYLDEKWLLRTHTSPVQARTLLMKQGKGPVKILCPGKVYRRDNDDATHSHQFYQIEGLVVDKNITMADLKGTLDLLAKKMFGEKRTIRLRSSYFPFTEPSVEVDVSCYVCNGKGCSLCKQTGWIEILGAGMVHPNVLEMAGFDSKIYQGFAFGIGVERIAMLRYGIDDIRHLYSNDLRVIRQFAKER